MIDFHVHQPRSGTYGPRRTSRRWTNWASTSPSSSRTRACSILPPLPTTRSQRSSQRYLIGSSRSQRWIPGIPVPQPRSSGASSSTACVASSCIRGSRASLPTSRGSTRSARWPPQFGVPVLFHDGTPPFSTPLQLASLARRQPDTTVVLGHGGLQDLWREAIAAVETTSNVHLCMCGTPPYAMRAIVSRCPLDRLLFGTDAGLRTEPLPATPSFASGSSTVSASAPPSGRRSWRTIPADSSQEHRDDRRPHPRANTPRRRRRRRDRRQHEMAARSDRAATTTWAEYEQAFADVDVSVAFTIARDRERVDPASMTTSLPSSRRRPDADRLSLGSSGGRRVQGRARARVERSRARGDQAGAELPELRPARRGGAAALRLRRATRSPDPLPPGSVTRARGPASVRPSAADGRGRNSLPRASHRDGAHGASLVARDDRHDSQASARVCRCLGAVLPPLVLYEGMRLVTEWNVFDKLLFGSDYPIATPAETAAGLRRVNEASRGPACRPCPSRRSRRSSSATHCRCSVSSSRGLGEALPHPNLQGVLDRPTLS